MAAVGTLKKDFAIWTTFNLSSGSAFNLDQSEILSFGKGFWRKHWVFVVALCGPAESCKDILYIVEDINLNLQLLIINWGTCIKGAGNCQNIVYRIMPLFDWGLCWITNSKLIKKGLSSPKRGENIVKKGKQNTDYKHFLILQQYFKRLFPPGCWSVGLL